MLGGEGGEILIELNLILRFILVVVTWSAAKRSGADVKSEVSVGGSAVFEPMSTPSTCNVSVRPARANTSVCGDE